MLRLCSSLSMGRASFDADGLHSCPQSARRAWLPLPSSSFSFLLLLLSGSAFLAFCFFLLRLLPFDFAKIKNPQKDCFLCLFVGVVGVGVFEFLFLF